jgi:tetratricopeptide (TPR) repeat protein
MAMRYLLHVPLSVAILSLCGIASMAMAQQPSEEQGQLPPITDEQNLTDRPLTEETAREDLLDALFTRLADPDAADWEQTQSRIVALWNASGSASMDLLATRADRAMEAKDYNTALLHLNDLTRLAPEFAEGWNKRATLHFVQGDYGPSLEDIARTLRLEPRHFGALAGLGIILDRLGDSKGALEAYRRAVAVHPNLEGAQEGIRKLERDVEGERL